MKLTYIKPHKSIRSLPDVELPNFAIITGINGSGKTHLLEAIENGSIKIEDTPKDQGGILRYDWSTFAAKINENSSPDQIHHQREQAIDNAINQLRNSKNRLPTFFSSNHITGDPKLTDPEWLAQSDIGQISQILTVCTRVNQLINEHNAATLAKSFEGHRSKCLSNFIQQLKSFGDLQSILENKSIELNQSILSLSERTIRASFPLVWNPSNTLQLDFSNWFSAWHAAFEYNKVNKYYNTQEGEQHRHYLSDEEFKKQYGSEPWLITNEILKNAGFRHQFNYPSHQIGALQQPFRLRLIDTEDNTEITTNDLSSGEKILLAVVLMLYQASGDQNLNKLPKIILLDEIDAPLHPSFTRSLIETLAEKFSRDLNVGVIMTTHSPSTVALSPDGSIYELCRNPRELCPCAKSMATQILSSGYISVSRNDTVVITESSADPEYYSAVYSALVRKGDLPTEPSLSFISASQKRNDGNGGGCTQVKNWAPKLHELGLERFRGLIDKDGNNQADSVVKVIDRYSIENYLFDPFTLTAYLSSRSVHEPFTTSLPPIREFLGLDSTQVNTLIMQLCSWLATKTNTPEINDSPVVDCNYLGHTDIKIPSWWITFNGHELEKAIRPPLNAMRNIDALIKANDRTDIIKFQTIQFPELISLDFTSIFSSLIDS